MDFQDSMPSFNITPLVDFLFLVLSLFATVAISRSSVCSSGLQLAKSAESEITLSQDKYVNISIDSDGRYKWVTDISSYNMPSTEAIKKELLHQYSIRALPIDKTKTTILLHIDRRAPWEAVSNIILCIEKNGFQAQPVYDKYG